jgi:hypothetical protein
MKFSGNCRNRRPTLQTTNTTYFLNLVNSLRILILPSHSMLFDTVHQQSSQLLKRDSFLIKTNYRLYIQQVPRIL